MLVWVLAACDGVRTVECDASLDPETALVAHVTWETPKEGASSLTYTWEDVESTVSGAPATAHDLALVGIPPLTDVAYTATTTADGRTWQCSGTIRTGNLPTGTPELTITVNDPSRTSSERYLFGSAFGAGVAPMFAIDRDGRWLWARHQDPSHIVMLARPSRSGGYLHNRYSREPWFRNGELYERTLGGEDLRVASTDGSHHVFTELEDLTVGLIYIDVRDGELSDGPHTMVGDAVFELSPDGTPRELWSSWDHIEVRDDIVQHPPYWPEGLDWTHANALFYVEERDAWLFSMANIETVVEIDRSTGETTRSYRGADDWTLAGDDYTVASGLPFRHQHDVQLSNAGNLLMFASEADTRWSGAYEYAIDDDARTLTEVWRYVPDPRIQNPALGQVQELENGNRLVAFNFAGIIQEVTPDGDVVWEAHTPLNTVFGQVFLLSELPR